MIFSASIIAVVSWEHDGTSSAFSNLRSSFQRQVIEPSNTVARTTEIKLLRYHYCMRLQHKSI